MGGFIVRGFVQESGVVLALAGAFRWLTLELVTAAACRETRPLSAEEMGVQDKCTIECTWAIEHPSDIVYLRAPLPIEV